jgi:acyl-CoA thioester hydrolase
MNSQPIPPHALAVRSSNWFEYPVRVSPHHTDHGGVVWHGSYLTWMEEARIEALRAIGVDYATLVTLGCELPVVDLNLRYHRAVKMGEMIIVRCQMQPPKGVRLIWDYEIRSTDYDVLHLSGQVTLVTADWQKGKILRSLPPVLEDALQKLVGA